CGAGVISTRINSSKPKLCHPFIRGDLLVLGTTSGQFQQMRADETLARIETFQSNEAGYGVVELKIGAVPAEGGRSDDQHARGVDPIDQHGPPLSREIPHPAKSNQRECRKPDSDRNQSDATYNRMLSPRFRLQILSGRG